MKRRAPTLCVAVAMLVSTASADPLTGKWVLNVGRSHYGGGAERRKQETFVCEAYKQMLRCTMKSERVNGKRITGTFAAAYDGKPYAASGIPDVDHVSVIPIDDHVADATFFDHGRPAFGYRAIKSDDDGSLTFVSVDPRARTVLNSVVVYDRR